MGKIRKYREAGKYLKTLRVQSGHRSLDAFVKLGGDRLSYDRASRLENGLVDPKARDLAVYYELTGCEAIALLQIPV